MTFKKPTSADQAWLVCFIVQQYPQVTQQFWSIQQRPALFAKSSSDDDRTMSWHCISDNLSCWRHDSKPDGARQEEGSSHMLERCSVAEATQHIHWSVSSIRLVHWSQKRHHNQEANRWSVWELGPWLAKGLHSNVGRLLLDSIPRVGRVVWQETGPINTHALARPFS